MGACCASSDPYALDIEVEEEKAIAEHQAAMKRKRAEKRAEKGEKASKPLTNESIWVEVNATFDKYDADGNGQLDLEEATKYISDWCKKKGLSAEEANIVSTFDDIDENGDGYLSKEELFNFLKDQKALHSEIFEVKYSQNFDSAA